MKSFLVNLLFFSLSFFLMDLFLFKSFENTARYYFVTGMTCATLAFMFSFDEADLWQQIKKLVKKSKD